MRTGFEPSYSEQIMEDFLKPKGVALVGASDRSAWSRTAFMAGSLLGFDDRMFLVSRSGADAHGRQTVQSIASLSGDVDTAVFMIPGDALPAALDDAAAAGVRYAVILASGFGELGQDGQARQDALLDKARRLGIRFMGPNCLGYINYVDRTAACVMKSQIPLRIGEVAILSQSGAIGSGMARFAHQQGIGLSHLICTGNEADIDFTAVAPLVIRDERVRAIAFFVETVRNPERFLAMAELAREYRKPLVMLKVGASPISAQVASAHTGALVGDDKAFDAVCRHYGIIRVDSLEDVVLTAALAAHTGPIRSGGLAVLSISGGACEIIADAADREGVDLVPFAPETLRRLGEVLPAFGTASNPLDLTGGIVSNPELFERAVRIAGNDPGVGMLGCVQPLPASEDHRIGANRELLRSLGRGLNAINVPGVMVNQATTPVTDVGAEAIRESDLRHVIGGLNTFIAAAGRIFRWSKQLDAETKLLLAPSVLSDARPGTEHETLDYLRSRGVPTIPFELVSSPAAAAKVAERLGGRLVVKIASADIPHKTEAGGVILNVVGADAAAQAFEAVVERAKAFKPQAQISGAVIVPMRDPGVEFVVGVARDPQWGAILAVGLGGVWVEVMKDVQLLLAGSEAKEIAKAIRSLRAARLLEGYRGAPGVNIDRLAKVIASIAAAALALGPDLAALEINPLRVVGDEIEALDALAVWA